MKLTISILFIILSCTVTAQVNKKYWVGSGGNSSLTIDGTSFAYTPGDTIVIRHGGYNQITVQNFNYNITIMNDSSLTNAVVMDGVVTGDNQAGIEIVSCSHIHITGNPLNASVFPYGFIIQNDSFRPTSIGGSSNKNDTLQCIEWYNIGDYVIDFTGTAQAWDGTNATLLADSVSFQNDFFDSCTAPCFQAANTLTTSVVDGLTAHIEIATSRFRYCDGGDLAYFQPTDRYNIHGNTFYQCNYDNDDDNGLFHMIGNGDFYNNSANNYQGHFIRMWTLSFGSTPETNHVYNNIADSSRKYSMFEWQSTSGANVPAAPNTTYVNIELNNNIAGDLNYQQNTAFGAYLCDNYTMPTGSTQQIRNNLCFNNWANSPGQADPQGSIFQYGLTADTARDWYYTSSTAAGFNTQTLYLTSGSPAINAGVSGSLLSPTDYHGTAFNISSPSIGAVSGSQSSPPVSGPSITKSHLHHWRFL